jgi:hypothetical protein
MAFIFCVIAFEIALVITVLGGVIGNAWRAFAKPFPERVLGIPSFRRNFQSIQLGILGLGLSIHIAIDDDGLHLIPARYLRWFGCMPASIAWECIEVVKTWKYQAKIHVGKTTIVLPRWCIEPKLTTISEPQDAL